MAEQLLNELENAAQVILAPPNLITTEQRRSAEEVFLNFRKLKNPYELCRQILETNTNDYILFESVGLIKIAVIREWSSLSQTDTSSLRDYLLRYVLNKSNLPPYVKGCILQVIAIIIKRGSVDDSGEARQHILGEVENLIMTGDLPKKIVGCNLISAVIQEYIINLKSTNVDLTYETHFKEKRAFQAVDLKRIFKFSIRVIDELIKQDLQENSILFLKHLLPILENIFTWSFINTRKGFMLIANTMLETGKCPPLQLDKDWQEVILVPAVLESIFTLYWKIRANPQLAHHVRTCLIQMVHLSNVPKDMELQYLTNYTEKFLNFITSIDVIDEEASSVADIMWNLLNCGTFRSLPEAMLNTFLEQLWRLTCIFLQNSIQEESLSGGECLYTEALYTLFHAWTDILFVEYPFSVEILKQASIEIFNIYLRCHLSPPEGVRSIKVSDLEKEEPDNEDKDRVKFKHDLVVIATFGRLVPSYTLPLLAQLIENRTSQLRENLNKSIEQMKSLNTVENDSIIRLYEDIHWLVLMIGHILCSVSDNELPFAPHEIKEYDGEQVREGKVDMDLTLQFLASSENVSSPTDIAIESVGHVIRLVADIFRLCAIEKTTMSVLPHSILSPELSCTLIWFLRQWYFKYFLSTKPDSSKPSLTYAHCFGEDTPGASWFINFLLEKIECNINAYKSEPEVMEETIQLLRSLVSTKKKASYVLKSERFRCIINLATKGQHDFPQVVKRGLMQAVVRAAVGVENEIDQSYWMQTLQPLLERFKQVTCNEKFLRYYQQEDIKMQVADILDCYIGVVQGAHMLELRSLYRYIQPVLREVPNLISLYHNYEEIIQLTLELLFECVKGPEPVLRNFVQTEAAQMSDIYLNAIQNYRRCRANRLTIDSTAEDDSYQDILLLMKLLTNLLWEAVFQDETVFLHGLTIIMPMVTIDLLKFPTFCLQYFQMIESLCKLYTRKVFNLSPELLQPLLASIEFGLLSFGHEVSMLCCNIIHVLTRQIFESMQDGRPQTQIMAPFLNLLITVILTEQVGSDFISNVGIPICYLIHCYRDEYNRIVQNILSTQSDQHTVQRLTNAFAKLIQDIHSHDIKNSVHIVNRVFTVSFDEFISNVQGFLMVK